MLLLVGAAAAVLSDQRGQQARSSWPNDALEVFDEHSAAGADQPAMQGSGRWPAGPRGDSPPLDGRWSGGGVADDRLITDVHYLPLRHLGDALRSEGVP